jgi:hypothetical protein
MIQIQIARQELEECGISFAKDSVDGGEDGWNCGGVAGGHYRTCMDQKLRASGLVWSVSYSTLLQRGWR